MSDLRYQKQINLKEIGLKGQSQIRDARVLIVGAGGLGCPALQYLSSMGVENITLVDNDIIDESNLARQFLYSNKDIGRAKVVVAKERIEESTSFALVDWPGWPKVGMALLDISIFVVGRRRHGGGSGGGAGGAGHGGSGGGGGGERRIFQWCAPVADTW